MPDKNFYIMLASSPWGGPSLNLVSGPDVMVDNGHLIPDVDDTFKFTLDLDSQVKDASEFPPRDIHETSNMLIFSKKLINVLQKENVDNVQYFDSEVVDNNNKEVLDYSVANIVGIVGALDMDSSEVILTRRGNVAEIEKMVLVESKMEGHKIFRLKESILHIIVHKSVKEAIETAGLKGFMFVSDDEYNPGML